MPDKSEKQEGTGYTVPSKLPKGAKLVFKGTVWDVYQWKQKLFDGTYATYDGLKRKNAVKIIASSGKRIFISKETRPGEKSSYYTLLGGTIEKGETPLDAAKRELLEEAGLKSGKWGFIDTIDVLRYPFVDYYVFLFIAKDCIKTSKQKLDGGESINVEKISISQFAEKMKTAEGRHGSASAFLTDPKWIKSLMAREC
jgi:ADP-ribose pyrophosphatase